MAVKLVNVLGVAFFTIVLCWRVDRLYRAKAGIQAVAVTVAIAALTVAVLMLGSPLSPEIDSALWQGASRLCGYASLALGVAALAVAFFYGPTESARQRRAGMEAIPLIAAVVGLSVAMTAMSPSIRNANLDAWSVQDVSFAVFFAIAGVYLMYGLGDCVLSLTRLMPFADGYLVTSLRLMSVGLGLTAIGSLTQVVFVVTSVFGFASWPVLLTVSQASTAGGIIMFVVGLSYPGVRGFFVEMRYRRRHRRDYKRLEPLWSLLTGAVPEVVLHAGKAGRDPHLRFQRRIVEIRDVLVQLSPYLPDDFGDGIPEENVHNLLVAMDMRIEAGPVQAPSSMVLPPDGPSIDDDAAPLLALADAVRATPADELQM
ncbi:MAB_1171c family putative transporter [Tsukamurella sp. 1534]|uniref:MAB_1171c family putative transporter n=1 Tax=Tsukamurella sp. 1534 TaxID=1151061 RepID=UPI0005940A70|nr:MAB_1171c family putative transporter [Tsukamurella sp. 1534]